VPTGEHNNYLVKTAKSLAIIRACASVQKSNGLTYQAGNQKRPEATSQTTLEWYGLDAAHRSMALFQYTGRMARHAHTCQELSQICGG
jgi:hypothetical protein